MASQVLNNPKPQIFVKPDGTPYKFSAQKGYGDLIHTAIKEHGGIIEINPRAADYTLVHSSVTAKRGDVYYNWKLITDCCNANPPTFFTDIELERYRMPETAKTTGRSSFSKRDDDLIREVLLANENVGGNVIWKKFAADHPESVHTWQSWRDRALKKIKPTLPTSTPVMNVPAIEPPEETPTASRNIPSPVAREITTSPLRTPPLRPARTGMNVLATHSSEDIPTASGNVSGPVTREVTTSPMRTTPLRPTRTVIDHSPNPHPSPTSERGRPKENRAINTAENTESRSDNVRPITRAEASDLEVSKMPGKFAKRRKLEVTVEVISLKRRR